MQTWHFSVSCRNDGSKVRIGNHTLLMEATFCSKGQECCKIQKYHYRALFPEAFNVTAAKKLHKVAYPSIEMLELKHQLKGYYTTISTPNLFHYLSSSLHYSLFFIFLCHLCISGCFSASPVDSLHPPPIPRVFVPFHVLHLVSVDLLLGAAHNSHYILAQTYNTHISCSRLRNPYFAHVLI